MSLRRIEQVLFFSCLIFLPTQLGKHFWPQFSLVYSLPIDYLSPTLYFWDILILSLILIWVIHKPKINWTAVNLGLIFILTLLPSLISAVNIGAGLVQLFQIMMSLLFGVYLASQNLEKIKKLLAVSLSLAVFYESIIAILEFLSGSSLNIWILGERNFSLNTPAIATFNYLGQLFLRPYATFPHPNVLGVFMVITLSLIWVFKDEFSRSWSFLNILLASLTTLLTFSRATILVLFVELLIGLKKRIKYLIIPIIILLPILWIRYNSAFNFESLSIVRREELAGIALNDFGSSPIFGIGLNNFINRTSSSNLISGTSRFLQPVHNIFLLSLAETGVLGFGGFILLLGFPVLKLWRGKDKKLNQTLLLIWASIFFLGMFDHYFLTLPQGQRLLFLIWGLSMLG
ncbi:MAG: O-antigen ligase family protein [Candidatus Paceibacterales bacterium]